MTRPGWLVRDENDARDEALRRGDDEPSRDGWDEPVDAPEPIRCSGCPACRAVERARRNQARDAESSPVTPPREAQP